MNKILRQLLIALIVTLILGLVLPFTAENNQLVAKPIGQLPNPAILAYFITIIFLVQFTKYTKPQLKKFAEFKAELAKLAKDPNVVSVLISFTLFVCAIFIIPHSSLGLIPLFSGIYIIILPKSNFDFFKALKIFLYLIISLVIAVGLKFLITNY